MYRLDDTIAAISSPTADRRVIIRISGRQTLNVLKSVFEPASELAGAGIYRGSINIEDLKIESLAYIFISPFSYTGQDSAELHFNSNSFLTGLVLKKILESGARLAGPGEFTARAYLNGKMDLAQAEAVNEVIVSSNILQLEAAEKLLSGGLKNAIAQITEKILDILSLIEAGLDFSAEDIEVISSAEAVERLSDIKRSLEKLLSDRIADEAIMDLPSVGIAGTPNAGKSSLLNCLLGTNRSIVSESRKTTRDILTGIAQSKRARFVLFDCAGLIVRPENILDELAQKAAADALSEASLVLFCVDISKEDVAEDMQTRGLINPKRAVYLATKADLVSQDAVGQKLNILREKFGGEFLLVSTNNMKGIVELWDRIDRELLDLQTIASGKMNFSQISAAALTARHRQSIEDAIVNIDEAIADIKGGSDEIAAMMMRSAYEYITDIEQQGIEDKVLENIFGRFCIGK